MFSVRGDESQSKATVGNGGAGVSGFHQSPGTRVYVSQQSKQKAKLFWLAVTPKICPPNSHTGFLCGLNSFCGDQFSLLTVYLFSFFIALSIIHQ